MRKDCLLLIDKNTSGGENKVQAISWQTKLLVCANRRVSFLLSRGMHTRRPPSFPVLLWSALSGRIRPTRNQTSRSQPAAQLSPGPGIRKMPLFRTRNIKEVCFCSYWRPLYFPLCWEFSPDYSFRIGFFLSTRGKLLEISNDLIKGAVSRYSVIFCTFLREQKMAAARASANSFTAQAVSSNVIFLKQLLFSAAFPCGRHYFSPHKMAAKNHRLSWHCRFKIALVRNILKWTMIYFKTESRTFTWPRSKLEMFCPSVLQLFLRLSYFQISHCPVQKNSNDWQLPPQQTDNSCHTKFFLLFHVSGKAETHSWTWNCSYGALPERKWPW